MDEELLTRIRKEAYEQGYQDGMVEGYNSAGAKLINRKKGRWNTDTGSPEYATCSVCGHCDWDCTESEYFKYCPNCGAKMCE